MDKLDELFRQNPNLERLLRPDADELEGLSESIQILRSQREADPESVEVNFQLATTLISHSRKSLIEEGIRLMEALVYQRWQANWSEMVGDYPSLPPSDAPSIARGVTVSRATAPPELGDDDSEGSGSFVEVSESSEDEASAANAAEAHDESATSGAQQPQQVGQSSYISDVVVSQDPTEVNRDSTAAPDNDSCRKTHSGNSVSSKRGSVVDEDASKIRPGRIDDLALYHYYLALGWIKMHELDKAMSSTQQMLLLAPHNKQGRALQAYIEVAGRQRTAVDAGAVAGICVVLAGVASVAGVLLRGKQQS